MYCGMMFLTIKSIRREVILGHVGCGSIGMILVWSGASFQEDSEPGGPMIRAFLIGLKNAKYSLIDLIVRNIMPQYIPLSIKG